MVQPVTGALKLSTDQPAYAPEQLKPSHCRSLLTSTDRAVSDWLDSNAQQHGSYVASSSSTTPHSRSSPGTTRGEGTLVFTDETAAGAGNSSEATGVTNSLILAGTSRWPNEYNARQLQMSVLVLFVVLIVASLLQLVVIGVWRIFKFKPEDLPK